MLRILYMFKFPPWNSDRIFTRTFKYLILRNTNSCTNVLGKTACSGSTELLNILIRIFCWKRLSIFVQDLVLHKKKDKNVQANIRSVFYSISTKKGSLNCKIPIPNKVLSIWVDPEQAIQAHMFKYLIWRNLKKETSVAKFKSSS